MFGEIVFVLVESGTVLRDEETGQEETVTDTAMVMQNGKMHVTRKGWNTLKERVPAKDIIDKTFLGGLR